MRCRKLTFQFLANVLVHKLPQVLNTPRHVPHGLQSTEEEKASLLKTGIHISAILALNSCELIPAEKRPSAL